MRVLPEKYSVLKYERRFSHILIFRELTEAPCPTAVALGYFDGVHLGHKEVIGAAVNSKAEGLTPCVFTFSSTPKRGTEK